MTEPVKSKLTESGSVVAVIDTNIVISTLIFGGRFSSLRLAWQQSYFVPLVSKVTATEIIRVLAYPKFQLSLEDQTDLLADYLPFCRTVSMPTELPIVPECRDPKDVPFMTLAVVGKADYIVTGDKDLLTLRDEFSCPIVTVGAFLSAMNQNNDLRAKASVQG